MRGLVALFLGVIVLGPIDHDHGFDCFDDNSQVGDCHNCVGCFDGNCGICNWDVDGSFIHSYAQQEDEPFSFPLAASCPWQSSQERQPPCWSPDTAQRKQSS